MSKVSYHEVKGDIVDMHEVPLSPRVSLPAPAPVNSRGRFFVNGCCCCCSLSSGVTILALLDLLQGIGGLLTMAVVVFARTHEHALDAVIEKSLLNSTELAESLDDKAGLTEETPEEQISEFNRMVEVAANWLPLVLLYTAIMIGFALIGFRAARGDVVAACRFYRWKLVHAIFAVLFALSPGGLVRLMIACYFAVVARSQWVTLKENQLPTYFVATAPNGAQTNAAPHPAVTSTPIAFVGVQAS